MRFPTHGVLAAALVCVGCGITPEQGSLQVVVELAPGLRSRCVKVTAADQRSTRSTSAISLDGKMSPLRIGVRGDGVSATAQLQAVGYVDDACTQETDNERSDVVEGRYGTPPVTVNLLLRVLGRDGGSVEIDGGRPDAGVDAGTDAGVPDAGLPDAGTDAGFDAGIDQDQDGTPLPDDCDDTNAAVHPGAAEACDDGLDNDCDTRTDCQVPACAGMRCMTAGGTCVSGQCKGPVEGRCNDGVDNDNDGDIDCADSDCTVGSTCDDHNACTLGDRCGVDGGCVKTSDVACNTPPGTCFNAVGACLPDAGTCTYTQRTGACDDGLFCTTGDTCTGGVCLGTTRVCAPSANACIGTPFCSERTTQCEYPPLGNTVSCDDGQNCSVNDRCAGDGGCAGTPVTCTPPSDCHQASSMCTVDGGCIFTVRTGFVCDAGMRPGICSSAADCTPIFSSCLDLRQTRPSAPSGVYTIDPDLLGPLTPFSVTCEMTVADGGWTVISTEDFSRIDGGWSDPRQDATSTCFTLWGPMLGGVGQFGQGATSSKTFPLLNIPHTQVRLDLDYYVIDSWDDERAQVLLDGVLVYDAGFRHQDATSNVCGIGWEDHGPQHVAATRANGTNSCSVRVTSTLDQDAIDESFGVDNVRVMIR